MEPDCLFEMRCKGLYNRIIKFDQLELRRSGTRRFVLYRIYLLYGGHYVKDFKVTKLLFASVAPLTRVCVGVVSGHSGGVQGVRTFAAAAEPSREQAGAALLRRLQHYRARQLGLHAIAH